MTCLRLHIVSGDRSPTLNLETPADLERPALCGVSQVQARVASAPFLLVQIFKNFPEMRRETVSRYWMSWIQLPPHSSTPAAIPVSTPGRVSGMFHAASTGLYRSSCASCSRSAKILRVRMADGRGGGEGGRETALPRALIMSSPPHFQGLKQQ